jgi:ElaB/YqjD/DUF883 family membrane-anchored ribosome-binding protein
MEYKQEDIKKLFEETESMLKNLHEPRNDEEREMMRQIVNELTNLDNFLKQAINSRKSE